MTKVTYYFGAGASVEALPIVNQIPERIKNMIEILSNDKYKLSSKEEYRGLTLGKTKYDYQKILIDDLEWLLESSANHASIDTFAKKLYIRKEWDTLKKLKGAFSAYLILEQSYSDDKKKSIDKRYDSFFASILTDSSTSFPNNIRILSWNYDFQFEKAYIEYSSDKRLEASQTQLNVVSKYMDHNPTNNKFGITKLNGTTSIIDENSHRTLNYSNETPNNFSIDFLTQIVGSYAYLVSYPYVDSGLSFAWEKVRTKQFDVISFAKEESKDTEILIVVGYSFPYFNRDIDRDIIGNMTNLKKVYFQAPDAEDLKERFLSIRVDIPQDHLLCRHNVGQFLLPNEL